MSENAPGRGFIPGAGVSGVDNPPCFPDAADALLDSSTPEPPSEADGLLLLADGTRYRGRLFGAPVIAEGELVFNGNQEKTDERVIHMLQLIVSTREFQFC